MENLKRAARENLRRLLENKYPGRGIVMGLSEDGRHLLQAYWIMGRSENSRNRVFVMENNTLRTEAADPARLSDPRLVIYTAMRELPGHYLVTNGDHTDTLAEGMAAGQTFAQVLLTRGHEPDEPNWTPRIAGDIELADGAGTAWLAILKANPFDPTTSVRQFFHYERLFPGFGWCITTYRNEGVPLPAFEGEPYLLPLAGTPPAVLENLWNRLNEENRISICVKSIDIETGRSEVHLRNAHKQKARRVGHG